MTEGLFAVHEVQLPGRAIGDVQRPTTLLDALQMLAGDPAKQAIAGGSDLLLNLHRGGPGDTVNLVDLSHIDEFRDITDAGDHWRLGGGVRHNQVVKHTDLAASALPLAQACAEVGSPQLRNRATIAGNLVTASPANDTISALMALGASIELSTADGQGIATRIISIDDFFTGFRSTVIEPGELISAISVPKLRSGQQGIWVKLGLRKAQAISVVHAGFVVERDDEGTIINARAAIGSIAPTVVIVREFANALIGGTLDAETIAEAAAAVSQAVAPIDDGRATAAYRISGVSEMVRRSLNAIAQGNEASLWNETLPTLSSVEELARDAGGTNATGTIVNGAAIQTPHGGMTLLDWLRESAGLTGSKEGCAEGECGACTVLVDGAAVMSCLMLAAQAEDANVVTVEGLGTEHEPSAMQQAFVDDFAVQCGFCIPGFIVSGTRLVQECPQPTDDQIKHGLSGNLCRCTGYYPIIEAVKTAAGEQK